jgi:hypothetical protein
MYWGANPVSAPTQAPSITAIVADGEDLVFTLNEYAPGADGWSTILNYSVTCGGTPTVVATDSPIRITGLASDTEYDCVVTATNAAGTSHPTIQLATTEAALQGLNIVIIRAALCQGNNLPSGC